MIIIIILIIIFYDAIIRKVQALGGKNVSHDALQKLSESLFKVGNVSELTTSSDNNLHTLGSLKESTYGKNCSSSRNGQPRFVTDRSLQERRCGKSSC